MTAPLVGSLIGLLVVIARVGGLVLTAPVLASPAIPKLIRVVIALTLGFAVWSLIPPLSVLTQNGIGLLVLLGVEFALGATIGFLINIPLVACQMSGTLMGQQMSLALPSMLDPSSGSQTDVLGQGFMMLAVVCFVVIGGVEQTFSAIVASFSHLQASALLEHGLAQSLSAMIDTAFEFALRMALPILAVLLLQTAALAIVARSMPQLNIFSIGLPLRILVGLLVLVGGLAFIGQTMEMYLPLGIEQATSWAGVV
jgi:flagellar biosynthetic protein FliR